MLGLDLFGEAWVSQRKKGKRKGSSSFPTCGWDYWKIDRRLNSADNLVDLDKWSITTSLAHPLFVTLDSEHTDFCSLEALFISTWTIQLVSYSIFRFLPLFSQSQQNQLKWLLSVPGTQELAGCFPGLFGCSYYMDLGTFWYRGWPCWSHGSAVDDGSRYSNWKVSHGVRWCQTFSHTKKTRRQSRVGSRLYVFSLSLEASLNHMFFPQKTSQLPAWQACLQVDFLRKLTALRTMRFWSPFFGPWNMESKEISELFVLSIHSYGFTWIHLTFLNKSWYSYAGGWFQRKR